LGSAERRWALEPSQFVCASVFLLIGIGMLVYGIRALTGSLPPSLTPWSRRRGPWPIEEQRRQSIVIGIAVVMGGTVLFVGGVGLMVISLL
jgi:hypothetical protein